MPDHIPAGFNAVTPYLLMHEPRAFLAWVRDALGATIRMEHYDDDGRLVHGEFELLGCVLELGQPAEPAASTRVALHVFVPDPDALYDSAIAHGASPLYPLQDHDYGERSGGVTDGWGNQWYFACVTDHAARNTPS